MSTSTRPTHLRAGPAPTARRPRRRPGLWAGLALLAVGVALLGYTGWQFYGTNVVAEHRQHQLVASTERLWAQQDRRAATGDGAGAGGAASPADTRSRAGGPRLRGAQALVRIPRFGRDYVVPVQQGVGLGVLSEGFGHFPGAARAGQVGNYALAAHRVTHGQPLRDMPDLRPGDHVVVQTRTSTYTYRIDTDPNRLVVPFTSVWVVDSLPRNPSGGVEPAQQPGQRLLTLTTCSELFHTDNRMVAFGHLVHAAWSSPVRG